MEPAVALTTFVPCSSAPFSVPQRVTPGCLLMGPSQEPTLAVVVLPNKFWYVCGEIWVVVARTHYPQSFTLLDSI